MQSVYFSNEVISEKNKKKIFITFVVHFKEHILKLKQIKTSIINITINRQYHIFNEKRFIVHISLSFHIPLSLSLCDCFETMRPSKIFFCLIMCFMLNDKTFNIMFLSIAILPSQINQIEQMP